jgi:hypothetical protein
LLRNGGSPTRAIAFQIVFGSYLDLVPIESMVLVEVRVLCSNYGVLEIGRNLAEGNEFVVFVIWPLANPGLQAALDVHRGCRWIDPPDCHKDQRGKRPKKPQANDEPSNEGSETAHPKRRLRLCVWQVCHISG